MYFFLDTSNSKAPLWYIGMTVAHVIFFFVAFAVAKARDRCLRNQNLEEAERER